MPLTGQEKAAIFLSSINEDAAAEILKSLSPQDITRISIQMAQLKRIDRSDLEIVLNEVPTQLTSGSIYVDGESVKKILHKSLGEDHATKILTMASQKESVGSLKDINTKTLSNFLVSEHPQTVAMILSLLEPNQAAETLSTLPEEIRSDAVIRMSKIESVPKDTIAEIEEVLGSIMVDMAKGETIGGTKTVAEILNQCDRATEQSILENIAETNDELADSIRQLMFVFEDILNIDDRGIQTILKEVSREDLVLALKSASEALTDKIINNMAERAAEMLKDEMEAKGPVKVSEVEGAQMNITKITRMLEEEGKIVIPGKGKLVL
jgi:flagellar motor switch protein FliG